MMNWLLSVILTTGILPIFLMLRRCRLAVAIAVDWVGNALPKATLELAKTSLIEKGIKPSYEKGNFGLG